MPMRLTTPTCPECGAAVRGTADLVPGNALLQRLGDGSYEYAGQTEMWWDGQMNEIEWERVLCGGGDGSERTVVLDCEVGHRWVSGVEREG